MGFEITDDDAIWMAFGTAAEAMLSWGLRKTTALPSGIAQYPSIASTAIIAAPAIMLAYTGMSDASRGMDRKLAAFLFGAVRRALSHLCFRDCSALIRAPHRRL